MKDEKLTVVETSWHTQYGARPLIGFVTIFDGFEVKTYLGTSEETNNMARAVREIVTYGAPFRVYTPQEWQRLGGMLPAPKKGDQK